MQFLNVLCVPARGSLDSKVGAEMSDCLDRRLNGDTRNAPWQSECGHAGKEVGSRQKHHANALSRSREHLYKANIFNYWGFLSRRILSA